MNNRSKQKYSNVVKRKRVDDRYYYEASTGMSCPYCGENAVYNMIYLRPGFWCCRICDRDFITDYKEDGDTYGE